MINMSSACAGSCIPSDSFRLQVFIGFELPVKSPWSHTTSTRLWSLQLLLYPKWPMIDIRRLIPLDNPFKGSENTALQNLLKLATSRLCRKPVSSKK